MQDISEKKKILIIDDSRLSRSMLKRSLGDELYTVDEAVDGAAGLKLLLDNSYHAIYVDFEMPGMNGFEVIKAIREMNFDQQPAIILLTVHERDSLYNEAIELGADAFINKGQSFVFPTSHLQDVIVRHEKEHRIQVLNKRLNLEVQNRKIVESQLVKEIDNRKRFEKELLEAKLLAEVSTQAKSNFLANMSHEIRTPMNGILGMAQILEDSSLTGSQKGNVQIILDSTESLISLVNDILDFSKNESGKLSIEKVQFNLQISIEELSSLMLSKVNGKGLELILNFENKAPTYVLGDSGRIRQILTNFIGNALKFTEEGHIVINIKSMEKEEDNNQWVRFEVVDTGMGIPVDKQKQVFEKFTQADASTTRKHGGTGLGLTICQQLAELMEGHIGLDSTENEGSTFWIEIPLGIDLNPPKEVMNASHLKDCRILYVDDLKINQTVFEEHFMFFNAGRVNSVSSVPEAMSAIAKSIDEKDPYKIIASDHYMPKFSGLDLGKQIKQKYPDQDFRMILLTSLGKRGDGQTTKDIGFSAYLLKPVHRRVLIEVCNMVMEISKEELKSSFFTRHTVREIDEQNSIKISDVNLDKNILLAEDNLVNQKVATKMLYKIGCSYDLVHDGVQAVDKFKDKNYDLILMDCQMPNMDGYEATRTIRLLETTKDTKTPIIAITAHSMEGHLEECIAAGMDDFITKPVKLSRLLSTIKKWTEPKAEVHNVIVFKNIQRELNLSESETMAILQEFYSDTVNITENFKELLELKNWEYIFELLDDFIEASSQLNFNFLRENAKILNISIKAILKNNDKQYLPRIAKDSQELVTSCELFLKNNKSTFNKLFDIQKL